MQNKIWILWVLLYSILQIEVVIVIYTPMYVDDIMAYVDAPFVKDIDRSSPLWKVYHTENDYGKTVNGAAFS